MNTSPSVLGQYQRIARLSGQMLIQARLNQWEMVVDLGHEYRAAVESLRALDHLSDSDRVARKDVLAQILRDDADIRDLAAPELARLGALLGTMKRQHSVLRAYTSSSVSSS